MAGVTHYKNYTILHHERCFGEYTWVTFYPDAEPRDLSESDYAKTEAKALARIDELVAAEVAS